MQTINFIVSLKQEEPVAYAWAPLIGGGKKVRGLGEPEPTVTGADARFDQSTDDDASVETDDTSESSVSEQSYAPPGTLFSRRHQYQQTITSTDVPPSDPPPSPPSENPSNEPCLCGR